MNGEGYTLSDLCAQFALSLIVAGCILAGAGAVVLAFTLVGEKIWP